MARAINKNEIQGRDAFPGEVFIAEAEVGRHCQGLLAAHCERVAAINAQLSDAYEEQYNRLDRLRDSAAGLLCRVVNLERALQNFAGCQACIHALGSSKGRVCASCANKDRWQFNDKWHSEEGGE